MITPGAEPGLLVEKKGPALHLTLARPEASNALDATLVHALDDALAHAGSSGYTVLVLTGQGPDFCLGMDIEAMKATRASGSTRPVHDAFARVLDHLHSLPLLTIALIRGRALGGGLALAAACDVAVARDGAQFGLPEALNGLIPANAAPPVARRIGTHIARRLALTTETVDADTALRLGLIDHLAADDVAAEGLVRRLAVRISRLQPEIIAEIKAMFSQRSVNSPEYRDWAVARITRLVDDHY